MREVLLLLSSRDLISDASNELAIGRHKKYVPNFMLSTVFFFTGRALNNPLKKLQTVHYRSSNVIHMKSRRISIKIMAP